MVIACKPQKRVDNSEMAEHIDSIILGFRLSDFSDMNKDELETWIEKIRKRVAMRGEESYLMWPTALQADYGSKIQENLAFYQHVLLSLLFDVQKLKGKRHRNGGSSEEEIRELCEEKGLDMKLSLSELAKYHNS